ncbi:MAG: DUF5668 domain-containing protein [Candidatus Kryptoniota bacterium]
MKVSRIFAGLLIILLGVALFLSNFDVLTLNWHFIFRLWPILLVFAGISVLVSNSKLKAMLYAVTVVLILIWIFSVASGGWGSFRGIFHNDRTVHHQEFSQDFEKNVQHAVLSLNSGAGSFYLSDTTNKLLEANSESNIGSYTLDAEKDGSTEKLDFNFDGNNDNYHWRWWGTTNKVYIKLNPKVDWELDMNIGASSTDFDLSQFAIRSADIKAGASSLKIKLGDKSDTTNFRMNTGASSVKIYIPQDAGCRISDEASLSSKAFPDFSKSDDGMYRTTNFENSKKKIFIDVEAGVSSIKVIRY